MAVTRLIRDELQRWSDSRGIQRTIGRILSRERAAGSMVKTIFTGPDCPHGCTRFPGARSRRDAGPAILHEPGISTPA
ncbi:hypothetical protein [Nitrosovibrio sp. Nv17]|uniref:hypothetical protein n=1 Tax=Nitrosovibrio sp. Nv17 TaxID=1855339 RepID=UPI0011602A32|nr:hypothetical protein [Nitrosovibrio sp. Nv17]